VRRDSWVLIKDAGIETGVFERNVRRRGRTLAVVNILNQCATVGTTIDVDIQVRTRAPRETIARLEKVLEDLVPSPLTEYGGKIFMDTTVPLQHGVVASVAPVWQVVKMEENVPFKSKVVGSTPASEAPHWHRLPWRLHV
jgi:hypothetical protein